MLNLRLEGVSLSLLHCANMFLIYFIEVSIFLNFLKLFLFFSHITNTIYFYYSQDT